MLSNSRRILGKIVSIDAWHEEFCENRCEANLHLEVVFDEALFGGNSQDKISFRIRLKKTDVLVILSEPLSIRRDTVWRPRREAQVEKVTEDERSTNTKGSAHAGLNVKGRSTSLSAGAMWGGSRVQERKQRTRTVSTGTSIIVEHRKDGANHVWSCWPSVEPVLSGNAFPPDIPIMKISHPRPADPISPSIVIKVQCRREDIAIVDIAANDPGVMDRLAKGLGREKKHALAIEMIKDALSMEGLEGQDISHDFSLIVIADVLAEAN